MIPIKVTVSRSGVMSAKEFRPISKLAWKRAGEYWHQHILKKHFRVRATGEYGYQERRKCRSSAKGKLMPGYEEQKFWRFGHRRPLGYTGKMRRAVMRIRDVRTVADNDKRRGAAKIVLHGPRYLYAYRKDLGQPDKAAELQAISKRDERSIARVVDEVLQEKLNEKKSAVRPVGGHRRAN